MALNSRARVLIVDGSINLFLGAALLGFDLASPWLGIPASESAFYPTILGGVLFGIGIALLWECFRGEGELVGLGLGGAIAINLSGGLVLTAWLLVGELVIPLRGLVILWTLALALVAISLVELGVHARRSRGGLQ